MTLLEKCTRAAYGAWSKHPGIKPDAWEKLPEWYTVPWRAAVTKAIEVYEKEKNNEHT